MLEDCHTRPEPLSLYIVRESNKIIKSISVLSPLSVFHDLFSGSPLDALYLLEILGCGLIPIDSDIREAIAAAARKYDDNRGKYQAAINTILFEFPYDSPYDMPYNIPCDISDVPCSSSCETTHDPRNSRYGSRDLQRKFDRLATDLAAVITLWESVLHRSLLQFSPTAITGVINEVKIEKGKRLNGLLVAEDMDIRAALAKQVCETARITGITAMISLYISGVPVEDIVR